MAKKVFDTPDLVRHIYSFGDPGHRRFTQHLSYDIRPYPDLMAERYQQRKLFGHYSYSMNEYLHEYSTRKIEWYLSTYKRCFCCSRHNRQKPIRVNQTTLYPEPMVFETMETDDCNCYCRHLSRIFTRHLAKRLL